MKDPIIGIDLGTTNSAAAVFVDGEVRFIENALGEVLTPSVIAVDPRSGTLSVGRTAKDILALAPSRAAAVFKRHMGEDRTFRLGERELGPVELSAHVLDTLRSDAETALGCPVTRCVVTVPAYFDEAQRVATRQAAELAGFAVERILNEPTAAAIAYGLHRREEETTFLVFDLGGGTFDVCVMELFEGMLEVKSVAGESRLGGEDFTLALRDLALERAGLRASEIAARDPETLGLLLKRSELLKRQLSRWPAAALTVPAVAGLIDEPRTVELTVEDVEVAWAPLLERLRGPVRAALRGANLAPDGLEAVVLVGGATRMPCVQHFVRETLGKDPLIDIDPDRVVAQGAAVQAALCADDAAVGDLVVTDVSSHSLGIDVAREIGSRHQDGFFAPIIHRNTVIPTSRVEVFATVSDDQTRMTMGVYEGESRRVSENRKLGQLEVKGIPRGPRGQPVEVRFTYDLNGILEVEATIPQTGKKFNRVFHREGGEVSPKDVARFRSRLDSLKADPLQRPRYRDAYGRAKLLWAEGTPEQRQLLDVVIDEFDVAAQGRNPQQLDAAYKALLAMCERIDGGERW